MWMRWRLAVLLLVALLAGFAPPAPVRAQEVPGPFVEQSFKLLLEKYVDPPSSSVLVGGGWESAVAFLRERLGTDVQLAAPPLVNQPSADWSALLGAYPQLVERLPSPDDRLELDRALVAGMARSLNSSHTFLTTATPLGQVYGGIGVMVSNDLIIMELFPNTPAAASGLQRGDRVLAVDGVPVEGLTSREMSVRVRGPIGSAVQISVQRGDQADPVTFSITRAQIVVSWVMSRLEDERIGYLRITTLPPAEALGEFDAALGMLEQADIKALVIDVRGNGGGVYATALKVISRFVQQGPILQRRPRGGAFSVVQADGSAWARTIPIVVLVNGGTGSGGELIASALQEHAVATVVGTQTAGGLAAGQQFPLDDGSFLTIATQEFRSGRGQEIEHRGVTPDEVVELDSARLLQGRDSQLEAALGSLRSRLAN